MTASLNHVSGFPNSTHSPCFEHTSLSYEDDSESLIQLMGESPVKQSWSFNTTTSKTLYRVFLSQFICLRDNVPGQRQAKVISSVQENRCEAVRLFGWALIRLNLFANSFFCSSAFLIAFVATTQIHLPLTRSLSKWNEGREMKYHLFPISWKSSSEFIAVEVYFSLPQLISHSHPQTQVCAEYAIV